MRIFEVCHFPVFLKTLEIGVCTAASADACQWRDCAILSVICNMVSLYVSVPSPVLCAVLKLPTTLQCHAETNWGHHLPLHLHVTDM